MQQPAQPESRDPLEIRFAHLAGNGRNPYVRSLGQRALSALAVSPETSEEVTRTARILQTEAWDEQLLAEYLARFFGIISVKRGDSPTASIAIEGDTGLVLIAEEAYAHLREGFREAIMNGAWFTIMKLLPLDEPSDKN